MSQSKRRYVTAFPGIRDSYQIPLMLSEQGRLAAFATCFYRDRGGAGLLSRMLGWPRSLKRRFVAGVHASRVHPMEFTNVSARLLARFVQPSRVAVWEDRWFARKAVQLARQHRASLLLYEFQAETAFRAELSPGARRILFHFHPHPDLEHPLLLADAALYPEFHDRVQRDTRGNLPLKYREHTRLAWRRADHVIVASDFSRRSLMVAGCPAERISVVPYGVEFPPTEERAAVADETPIFLFVGSGSHRKGLHHLLDAWRVCQARGHARLVVISRVMQPEMRTRLAGLPNFVHLPGVSADELLGWYARARAMVLPSICEGFGQVFLEALAAGCSVIGSRNSVLPDLTACQANIEYVEPGNVADIARAIDRVAAMKSNDPFLQVNFDRANRAFFSWARFREQVATILDRFD